MKKRVLILILWFAGVVGVSAQKLVASIDNSNIGFGDVIGLKYSLNSGDGHGFTLPEMNGMRVLSGPETRNEISFNGRETKVGVSYTYHIQATKKGKIVIGPAFVLIKGKKIFSNSLVLNVQAEKPKSLTDKGRERIFMRVIPDKTQAVQGEAISVMYKLYLAGNVSMAPPTITKMPNFTGFWAEAGGMPAQLQTQENYQGHSYQVLLIRRLILFPQRTGMLSLDPLEIECTGQIAGSVNIDPNDPFGDMFDQLMNRNVVPFHKSVASEPLKINVLPLPDNGKPKDFNGFVGQAAISASIDKSTVKANEPIIYRITIGGEGNLSLQQPLKLQLPAGIEIYDPKTIDKIDRNANNLKGTRTFEYTLMPHDAGAFKLPAIDFSSYDPITKKYKVSTTEPISITVEKNDRPLASDTGSNRQKKSDQKGSYTIWLACLGGICLLGGIFILFFRRNKPKETSVEPMTESQLPIQIPDFKSELDEASELALHDEHHRFYTVMLQTMYHFAGQLLQKPFSELSHDAIADGFRNKNIPESLIHDFMHVIDTCELVKFAPSGYFANKEDILNQAKRCLEGIGEFEI